MEYAKRAVSALIDKLSSRDYLSLVVYDDHVETLFPTQRIGDKGRIQHMVDGISPRGSTNLGGGMEEGFRQIRQSYKSECTNRVILLSDGLANRGVTDPNELERLAARYRMQGISLTAIGVGLDYNENLMLGLARHGGGSYYFVESPSQLASIFERELNDLSYVVAQNARIELSLGRGVTLNDVIGCEYSRDGDAWSIPVGDLYATDHREITVGLTIPEGAGTRRVASGVLKYDNSSQVRPRTEPRFSVDIRYSNDAAELRKGKDWDTQAKVDVATSTRKVESAMEALDAGRTEEAEKILIDARTTLQSSSAVTESAVGAPSIQKEMDRLDEYARKLQDDTTDLRRLKKTMQYNNYNVQKKKDPR